ncbi:MAG: FliH/SctL family protein [Thermodesulfovibrionales bacterium]|nr:FliH/SctL family protein [Thermodesulfovibrionales bacterium]
MFKKKSNTIKVIPYLMKEFNGAEDIPNVEVPKKEKDSVDINFLERIQELEREAYEKGFESGQKAGFEMGEKKALILIERLEKAINDFEELKKKQLLRLEKEILNFSIALAKKILLQEITQNPDILANIVKEALGRFQRTEQIKIRMHPSLQPIFYKNRDALMNEGHQISLEIDSKLPLYGVEIVGAEEIVITDVEEQFKNLLEDIGLKGE